jgi:beta-ureidopropionase
MPRILTIAMTETMNAFTGMPATLGALPELAGRHEEIRRANVDHHVALARTAAAAGVKVIGFGELFTAPYFASVMHPMWAELAEDALEGPTVTTLKKVAEELAMVIIAPIYEKDPRTGSRFNTAVVIDASGEILGRYRKTHIPNGANEQGSFSERYYYGPADDSLGDYFPVFKTRYGRIGVGICYDRHFDGVMRTLAHRGAELIFSPAVTFGAKSEHLWELEFEVDAARHRVFIAGSNRLGTEVPFGVHYFGKSLIVGPNGRIEASRDKPGLVIGKIDLDLLNGVDPAGWRLVEDRRNDIYEP